MVHRFKMVACIAAGLASVAMAPSQVGAESEPFATTSNAIPVPVIPALLTDRVSATPTLATPETISPTTAILETPKTAPSDDVARDEAMFDDGATLNEKVSALLASETGDRQLDCLAGAIYFESKGEPLKGQLAVGQVVQNRTKSGRFPRSYCGVVYQQSQFSFVRGGKMPRIDHSSRAWRTAVAVAKIVDGGHHAAPVAKSALFFHATYVAPKWGKKRVATIGRHVFY